jgi:hypothetical protein
MSPTWINLGQVKSWILVASSPFWEFELPIESGKETQFIRSVNNGTNE